MNGLLMQSWSPTGESLIGAYIVFRFVRMENMWTTCIFNSDRSTGGGCVKSECVVCGGLRVQGDIDL